MVDLVVLACGLRATTKKVVNFFFGGGKCSPPEKILATPMNLPTPGQNPTGAHLCLMCCTLMGNKADGLMDGLIDEWIVSRAFEQERRHIYSC